MEPLHKSRIRVISLGLIQSGDRLFVSEGYDTVCQTHFYRALGGGVDFGESSKDALCREFQEELGAALANIHYMDCIENRFEYNGQQGHEVIFLYRCDFADPRFYEAESVTFMEGDRPHVAKWVKGDRFLSGELRLVPPECLRYL